MKLERKRNQNFWRNHKSMNQRLFQDM